MLGNVNQFSPEVISGDDQELQIGVLGQMFADNWKTRLALAGKLWRGTVGTITGSTVGAWTGATGGGAGTLIDPDEPEIAISVGAGYFLIPVELHVSGQLDQDANAEVGEIAFTADRTQEPATVTGTALTLYNQLDGAGSFPGTSYYQVTSVATDPTNEELIAMEIVSASEFVSNGAATNITNGIVTRLQLDWKADYPDLIAGPCTLLVYWGGTAALTAYATIVVGCIAANWAPTA